VFENGEAQVATYRALAVVVSFVHALPSVRDSWLGMGSGAARGDSDRERNTDASRHLLSARGQDATTT
jgi:hypothetical protein